MPPYKAQFITTDELLKKIERAESRNCKDDQGDPLLTILDLRIEHHLKNIKTHPIIKTSCRSLFFLMDDLTKPDVRNKIPSKGEVITVTETGNRDEFVIRYLSQFGYKNVSGLLFGMRSWIKTGYPTEPIRK